MTTTEEIVTILPNLEGVVPDIIRNVLFSWYDYLFFTLMLLLSVVIGIYFGCFGSKQSTANEYLLGGKQMKVLPIGISLVAGHCSGITLLGVPADVYKYGASFWWSSVSMIFVMLVTIFVFLPVFYKMQITSTYEYLERRFDRKIRQYASFLFALSMFLYLPIVIYIPALAFSAASGLSIHLITPIVCGICIFYTAIGGLKAVVWTDTLQFIVTIGALVAVFILGLASAGGISSVWQKSIEGGRLDMFDFDVDPTRRDTFWVVAVGITFHWVSQVSVNQGCVQKFLAVSTLREANLAVLYYGVGYEIIKTLSIITGLIMYAKYAHCDPFTTKTIVRNDQLLPYYVMDVAEKIPGLPGLFMAGVFSSALSTLSACLNCLAGTIYEDFVIKFMKDKKSADSSNILKIIVVLIGVISTVLVFVFERLGGILQLTISISGIVNGPLLGLFCLGALIPRANCKGALYGSNIGMFFVAAIWLVTKYYEKQGVGFIPKPVSVDGCSTVLNATLASLNLTLNTQLISKENNLFFLFRISYYYYTLIGTLVTVGVGTTVSYMCNKGEKVNRDLLSPVIHPLLDKEKENEYMEYLSIDKALHMITRNDAKEAEANNTHKNN